MTSLIIERESEVLLGFDLSDLGDDLFCTLKHVRVTYYTSLDAIYHEQKTISFIFVWKKHHWKQLGYPLNLNHEKFSFLLLNA